MYIATRIMTNAEKERLTKMFMAIDKNADGRLSRRELIQAYNSIFGSSVEVSKLVDDIILNIDINKSGSISYTEFLIALMDKKRLLSKDNLKQAFEMFDKDKSGYIDIEEVKSTLGVGKNFSEDIWKFIIDEIDQNKDGKISFDEFEYMMKQFS